MWMSLDVHFSTVSTLHLCCIAVDRYFAIVRPLKYTTYMTVKVAACMIAVAWTAPIVISFLPIFLGWNTTQDHIDWRELHQDECILRVCIAGFLLHKIHTRSSRLRQRLAFIFLACLPCLHIRDLTKDVFKTCMGR